MTSKRVNIWRAFSVLPPAVLGVAGAVILSLEGRIHETALVLIMVGFHRYSSLLLRKKPLTAEETADWSAAHVLTTVGCYALPFFIAATMR